MATYGNDKLQVVLDHFGESKTVGESETVIGPVINKEEALSEWKLVKQVVRDEGASYSYKDKLSTMWQVIQSSHGKEFPNLLKLVKLVLIFPLQTATCERGFSVQNGTKTIKRNRLKEENLKSLMNIKLNGPPVGTFDFLPVLRIWRHAKDRKLYN